MIPAEYYQGIFLTIVTILSIICYNNYKAANYRITDGRIMGMILTVVLIFFIGLRPVAAVFVDTVGYATAHDMYLNIPFAFSWDHENILFDNLDYWSASIGLDHVYLFLFMALCYWGIRYTSCIKLFPDNSWIAFLFFLGSFITFTSSVNGMKAGVASSFFALAVVYRREWPKAVICLAIAWGFHHAFHVCIIAYIVAYFYKNIKVYVAFWIIALMMAILHISYFQIFFAGFTDEKGAGYLITDGNEGWITGMRYDFVLYGVIPIIVGWWACVKRGYNDKLYVFILNLYTLLNGVWMLCMYASFTNRIAALSWSLYPIVISYPFLSKEFPLPQFKKNQYASNALMLNLGFTLFMHIIYYGIIK